MMEKERGKNEAAKCGEKRTKPNETILEREIKKSPTINAQRAKNKLRSPSGMTSNPVGRRRVHTGIFSSSFLSRIRSSSSRFQSSFLSLDSLRSLIVEIITRISAALRE